MFIKRINLKISTKYDLELLENGITLKYTRVITWLRFKSNENWTTAYEAIVDTGNPITVIPFSIWNRLKVNWLSKHPIKLHGIGATEATAVQGKLGEVVIVFLDDKQVSYALKIKAYLTDTDDVPLLIGFEDILTNVKLVIDYKLKEAYLEFG